MLKNDYLLAKIGVDTAKNEPQKESCGRGHDVTTDSRGELGRGNQHSAVGRAPIPDSSDTPVSVS